MALLLHAISSIFLFFLAIYCHGTEGKSPLEVTTPAGTFVGTILTSAQGDNIKAFLGIPYALPPVGNLRFAKPKPYPKIKDTFQAIQNAPICIQLQGVDLGSPASEDCLYLNVYTPMSDVKAAESTSLRKVFVYIHGGGLVMGSANEQVPGDWVVSGDVIVVTLNYRLGFLGFVKGNTPDVPGNVGHWDQLTALKWVKDNIRSFGGDPDDITIGGNSAGSASVSILSITPHAKNLFTKAVMLSHTVFSSTGTVGSSDHLLYELADTLGCKNESTTPEDVDSVVQCLRKLPEQAFSLPFDVEKAISFLAVDGDLLPAPIPELINDQNYLTSVGFYSRDYITSVTSNEGIILLTGVFDIASEKEDYLEPEFFHSMTKIPLPVAEKIVQWYTNPSHFQIKPSYDLYGDLVLMMPSMAFAEVFASVKKDTYTGRLGNSYVMVWDFTPSYNPEGYQGFFHAMELCYIFDLPPSMILDLYYQLPSGKGFTEEDRSLKRQVIGTLTNFMKTGNPGESITNGAQWPTFDLDTEYYLQITHEPTINKYPLKQRRDFWKKDFLSYMEDFMSSQEKDEL